MSVTVVFFWRYSESRDSEIARSEAGDLKLRVEDCDGDASDWEVTRNGDWLAMGSENDHAPLYHFEAAKAKCELVARAIIEADGRNAFLKSDTYLRGCQHCCRLPEEHGKGWHSTCSSYVAPNRQVSA